MTTEVGIRLALSDARMATSPVHADTAVEADRLWHEITRAFREVCILRRQGRHAASKAILAEGLPPLVRDWSVQCAQPPAEAKARLSALFEEEQARIESNWIVSRFLLSEPATLAAQARQIVNLPATSARSPESLLTWFPPLPPRRIRIDDVVDMIDAARDLEHSVLPAGA